MLKQTRNSFKSQPSRYLISLEPCNWKETINSDDPVLLQFLLTASTLINPHYNQLTPNPKHLSWFSLISLLQSKWEIVTLSAYKILTTILNGLLRTIKIDS